jgi:acetyl esterase
MTTVSIREHLLDSGDRRIRIRDYLPTRQTGAPLVWVHGGAWVWGGLDQRESHAVAQTLAASGRRVRTVDFAFVGPMRLRPSEVRFPVPRDEVIAVTRDLRAETGTSVFLGGASAGASLALSAARELRGSSTLLGMPLAYGTFHARLPKPSPDLHRRLRGRHAFGQFTPDVVRRMNLNYAGSVDLMAAAHVGGSDLRGLPPVLLVDADRDALRASSETLLGELRLAEVTAEQVVVPETRHGFLDRPGTLGFERGLAVMRSWLASLES